MVCWYFAHNFWCSWFGELNQLVKIVTPSDMSDSENTSQAFKLSCAAAHEFTAVLRRQQQRFWELKLAVYAALQEECQRT